MKKEKLMLAIAWVMPRWLVYWCAIRLVTHATTGKYGHEFTDRVTILDALKRWHTSNED